VLPPDDASAEGALPGATGQAAVVLARALLRASVAPGRSAATERRLPSRGVLLDQGVAGAPGADQGRQLQWIGPAVKQGAEEVIAFGLVAGPAPMRACRRRTRGPKPLRAAFVAGVWRGRRSGWGGCGHGERDSDGEGPGETKRINAIAGIVM